MNPMVIDDVHGELYGVTTKLFGNISYIKETSRKDYVGRLAMGAK